MTAEDVREIPLCHWYLLRGRVTADNVRRQLATLSGDGAAYWLAHCKWSGLYMYAGSPPFYWAVRGSNQ